LDIRKVKKLIELLEESGIAEIEIHEGEESVRISRGVVAAPAMPAPAPIAVSPPVVVQEMAPSVPEGNVVKSPMVGTFYIASSPEAAPFVAIGKNVEIGDTVCVIEAMKIMNPIESEVAGTVTAILVENGHPIEYDQPLFIIA
jgi:acetyl-CoA carboxylase biotin carboxyl carrier protein